MPTRTLINLANISLHFGLIDHTEYDERVEVALWLSDDTTESADPRQPTKSELGENDLNSGESSDEFEVVLNKDNSPTEPDWMHFVAFRKWYFTRSDPDPYPSTPHGHLYNPNREWPKLNPYTGRVFKQKHQEDTSLRLTKNEMKALWTAAAFRDFCRSHILWYMEANPHYGFSVQNPFRFPRW